MPPTNQEICDRAYQLYLARGGSDGIDESDWRRAEAELRVERGFSLRHTG